MRCTKKIGIYALAGLLFGAAHGQTLMPYTTTSVSGGDEVRGRDGTTCRQGSFVGPTFDTGMSYTPSSQASQLSQSSLASQLSAQSSTQSQGVGIYARIVIPFGKQPHRIDCGRLYDLEIERLKAELARLKEVGSASVVIK